MPLITFVCTNPECQNKVDKLFKMSKRHEIPEFLPCDKCETGKLERTLGTPSSVSKFTIDNGLQAKKVEVIDKIWELNKERSDKGKDRGQN